MSVAWRRRVVAWAHATYQYHVNGMDMVGQSVGQSVDARGLVDHASVGLAQARPNQAPEEPGIAGCSFRLDIYLGECELACKLIH